MSKGHPTAATFREPLLRALGSLSTLTAGTVVKADEAMTMVLAETGIGEFQYGSDKDGKPLTRLWITQAFNRKLREEKLADSPEGTRGKWMLTEDGVKAASVLLSVTVPTPMTTPILAAAPDPAPMTATPDPAPMTAPAADLATDATVTTAPVPTPDVGVSWSVGEIKNNYHPDPYIQGIAVAATKCFGFWDPKSDVCCDGGGCPISGACKAQTLTALSTLAVVLQKEDDTRKAAAFAPSTTAAPAVTSASSSDELDINDILAAIEGKDPSPAAAAPGSCLTPEQKQQLQRCPCSVDSKCSHCSQKIPRGTDSIYIRGLGMYHVACAEQKFGIKV